MPTFTLTATTRTEESNMYTKNELTEELEKEMNRRDKEITEDIKNGKINIFTHKEFLKELDA